MILAVSRLDDMKRVDRVIRATAHLIKEKGIEVKLFVVGHGPRLKMLQELTKSLGVESNLRFEGVVRHEEVGKYYGAADAFVSCYRISKVGISFWKPWHVGCLL